MALISQNIGVGQTFRTIQDWITATDALVGTTGDAYRGILVDEVYEVSGGELLLDAPSATNSSEYRELFGNPRYQPNANTGAVIYYTPASTLDRHGIEIRENFFRLTRLAVVMEDQVPKVSGASECVRVTGDDFTGNRLFVKCEQGRPTVSGPNFTCYSMAGAARAEFYDCIAYGSLEGFGAESGWLYDAASTGRTYGCIAYNIGGNGANGRGWFVLNTTGMVIVNCLSVGCSSLDFSPGTMTDILGADRFEYNISSDNTAHTEFANDTGRNHETNEPGTANDRRARSHVGIAASSLWLNPEAQDFRLLQTSPAHETGSDETSQYNIGIGNNLDWIGFARVAPWGMGPYFDFEDPINRTPPSVVTRSIGSGGGRDYPTLDQWVQAQPRSLYVSNEVWVGQLYDDSVFDVDSGSGRRGLILRRTITDSTHYQRLEAAPGERYDPLTDTGVRIEGDGGDIVDIERECIRVENHYFQLDGVGVRQTATDGNDRYPIRTGGRSCWINACVVRGMTAGGGLLAASMDVSGIDPLITNTIAIGPGVNDGAEVGFLFRNAQGARVLHCLAYNHGPVSAGIGYSTTSLGLVFNLRIENCMSFLNDNSFPNEANQAVIQRNNVSDDNLAVGPGSLINQSVSDYLRDAASGDFRSLSTSPGLGAGRNILRDIATDFAGTTRSAPMDVGPFEGFFFAPLLKAPEIVKGHCRALISLYEIARTDGVVLRFTSDRRQVPYRGQLYRPDIGARVAARQAQMGLGEVNTTIEGFVKSGAITFDDLRAGRYRRAKLREEVISADTYHLPFKTRIFYWQTPQFSRLDWSVDAVGLTGRLNRRLGGVYQVSCPYRYGDGDCRADVGANTMTGVRVTAVSDDRRKFEASGIGTDGNTAQRVADYFGAGFLLWTLGNNESAIEVRVKTYSGSGGSPAYEFELDERMPFDIEVNDEFSVEPGCRKRLVLDCHTKHANAPNYGGEGFILHPDELLVTPQG